MVMMKTRHDDDEDKPHVQVDRDDGGDYDHDDVNKSHVQVGHDYHDPQEYPYFHKNSDNTETCLKKNRSLL